MQWLQTQRPQQEFWSGGDFDSEAGDFDSEVGWRSCAHVEHEDWEVA